MGHCPEVDPTISLGLRRIRDCTGRDDSF